MRTANPNHIKQRNLFIESSVLSGKPGVPLITLPRHNIFEFLRFGSNTLVRHSGESVMMSRVRRIPDKPISVHVKNWTQRIVVVKIAGKNGNRVFLTQSRKAHKG